MRARRVASHEHQRPGVRMRRHSKLRWRLAGSVRVRELRAPGEREGAPARRRGGASGRQAVEAVVWPSRRCLGTPSGANECWAQTEGRVEDGGRGARSTTGVTRRALRDGRCATGAARRAVCDGPCATGTATRLARMRPAVRTTAIHRTAAPARARTRPHAPARAPARTRTPRGPLARPAHSSLVASPFARESNSTLHSV